MGTGALAEAFLVAFKLPNFFRRLFAEGAFSAAFVPMFAGTLAEKGKEKAAEFAQQVLAVLTWSLVLFVIIMEVSMPWVMVALAPGFRDDPTQFALATDLTRITFPYLLCISLVSLFAGVLNSLGKFAVVAAMPIMLNMCLIFSLLFVVPYAPTSAHALSWGVAVAGVLQLTWIIIITRRNGVSLHLKLPRLTPDVRLFLRKMAPGIIGAGVVQINLWIDIVIATFLPGAIAFLYYADRVNQLPLSIIGTAMGAALLPWLSTQIRQEKMKEAISSQNRALEIVLFFTIPATIALLLIAEPIISVLFERGEFSAEASRATAYGLMGYALGLPAFVMVKVFSVSFFAHGNTKTPVIIASVALVTNVVLNIVLVLWFQKIGIMPHIGLAVATSISSWLNLTMLAVTLHRYGHFQLDPALLKRLLRILIACAVMAIVLVGAQLLVVDLLDGEGSLKVLALIIVIASGGISFIAVAIMLRAIDVPMVKDILQRRKVRKNKAKNKKDNDLE